MHPVTINSVRHPFPIKYAFAFLRINCELGLAISHLVTNVSKGNIFYQALIFDGKSDKWYADMMVYANVYA